MLCQEVVMLAKEGELGGAPSAQNKFGRNGTLFDIYIVQSRFELIHGWEPGFLDSIDSNFSKNNLARYCKTNEIFVLVVAFECAFEIINRTCRSVITNPSSKCCRWGQNPGCLGSEPGISVN